LSLMTDPDQVIECAGSLHCAPVNVAKEVKEYLDGAKGMKMAVTCKPCDARAIIELAKRGQINIENLILIGLNCTGTLLPAVARRMIKDEYQVNPDDLIGEDIDDGKFIITLRDGTKKERDLNELEEKGYGRRENCRRCAINIPRMADIACGKWGTKGKKATFIEVCSQRGSELIERAVEAGALIVEPPDEQSIEEREKKDREAIELAKAGEKRDLDVLRWLPYEERLKYWSRYFNRCIKCFGCRDVCPICYCQDCYLEPGRGFVKGGESPPDMIFPLVRLAHVADSCVNCGQCQDACPMEIPLTRLYHMLNRELSSMFDYIPGMDVSDYPPLTTVTDEELAIDDVNVFRKN
ncbi:MAG: Coenzyme F420 hydrogenase/dehydrogenase, beta subunit C-terminal domain, partial [Desulfobacterales bacterium]|nr:Coenzyme F420 hydrogenase/dehydrogenase, beta subunit C-terminal domain [Desulfobacterales bacterium]